ncbi:MAG: Ribonuclease VapC41 [Verrucomicrobiales bacterium]|nr:Ribonuclease VapC41 [Verrucomicrobiales bacterium]
MPGSLFDSNIWIATVFPTHPAHHQARQLLLEATPGKPAVFCRSTQQSFLRLATNPALLKAYRAEELTNRDALLALKAWLILPQVCEREEPAGLVSFWHQLAARDSACPKLWMDAYLAAFAIAGGLDMVTLDHDFENFQAQGLNLHLVL